MTRSRTFAGVLARAFGLILSAAAAAALGGAPARADRIKHPTAIFSGLDKITGRIISFEVATDETVQFGSLQITERACYTRPSTEAPQTVTFVQVDEVDVQKQYKRIFSGWMYAASPGLHGIEHPVYDIWLTDCKGGTEVIPSPETAEAEPPVPDNAKGDAAKGDTAKTDAAKADAAKDAAKNDAAAKAADAAKAERRARRAEERAASRAAAAQQARDGSIDAGPAPGGYPRRDPNRSPPSRSFFPDEAGGRDLGGLY